MSLCVTLNEYPIIRYYIPKSPLPGHESHILASFIASAVQNELDMYAQWNPDFANSHNTPRGTLIVVDRSMDLQAPFVHEFTYQAMAFDLLPIQDGDKVTYKTVIKEGRPDQEDMDAEISEKDPIWLQTRHMHMKDTIEKLMSDFQSFLDKNPNAKKGATANLNDIKDMLAGLPEFQEKKQAYSLHLTMAQNCMNDFEHQKLPELAVVEQVGFFILIDSILT
jgi:syntaxin-binding protein 1